MYFHVFANSWCCVGTLPHNPCAAFDACCVPLEVCPIGVGVGLGLGVGVGVGVGAGKGVAVSAHC